MPKRKTRWLIALAVLINAPLLVDRWLAERERRQDARDDELVRQYECRPSLRCAADFDGDGAEDILDVMSDGDGAPARLVVLSRGREILSLPYDHTDNTLRTHVALRREAGKPRLLVYDGVSYRPPLKSALSWDGERMVEEFPASGLDREILDAMAAHDDTGGWHERTIFRPFHRIARLVLLYALLGVAVAALLYRRGGGPFRETARGFVV